VAHGSSAGLRAPHLQLWSARRGGRHHGCRSG